MADIKKLVILSEGPAYHLAEKGRKNRKNAEARFKDLHFTTKLSKIFHIIVTFDRYVLKKIV